MNGLSTCDFFSTKKERIPKIKTARLKEEDVFDDDDVAYGQCTGKNGGKNCFNLIHVELTNPRPLKDNHICIEDNVNYEENDVVKITFNKFNPTVILCENGLIEGGEHLEKNKKMAVLDKVRPIVFLLLSCIGAEAAIKIGSVMSVDELLKFARLAYKIKSYKFNDRGDYKKNCKEVFDMLGLSASHYGIVLDLIERDTFNPIPSEFFFSSDYRTSDNGAGAVSRSNSELITQGENTFLETKMLTEVLDEIIGEGSYIYSEMKSINQNSLEYILDCKNEITKHFSIVAEDINKLHIALSKGDVAFQSYVNNYFSNVFSPANLGDYVSSFKDLVCKMNKDIKEKMENELSGIYIASTKQIIKETSDGYFFYSKLLEHMQSFEHVSDIEKFIELPFSFTSRMSYETKKVMVFLADRIFDSNPFSESSKDKKAATNIYDTIIHEFTHYSKNAMDFFYHSTPNGILPDLEMAMKELSEFSSFGEIESGNEGSIFNLSLIENHECQTLLNYIKFLCEQKGMVPNAINFKCISESDEFKDKLRMLNADSLALYIRDLSKYVVENFSSDFFVEGLIVAR
ncbi:hypothetical protein [Symbiopectobacterium purcellii]|uniref:hypothetical protein n=1 Tax=Symbiopectobacterium purcellii TaxID=2871826 RepID=UPI003F84BC65